MSHSECILTDWNRFLFGTSKLLVENMNIGMVYSQIKKIISVNIVYFDLGQGDDYIYHGTTNFIGVNKKDILKLSEDQKLLYKTDSIAKIYPEYYIIKVNQFNDIANNTLDEWVYFLKKDEIKDEFKAKGLRQAKIELDILKLSQAERKEYEHFVEQERYEESLIVSNFRVGELKGEIKGELKVKLEIAKRCLKKERPIDEIVELTGLSRIEISNLNNSSE